MNREDYFKDYYKSLEEAPLEVLEEHEGNTIAALEDYNAIGRRQKTVQRAGARTKMGKGFDKEKGRKIMCAGHLE
jgi:hypothetical protein